MSGERKARDTGLISERRERNGRIIPSLSSSPVGCSTPPPSRLPDVVPDAKRRDELTSRETSDPPSTPTHSNEPTIGRKVAGDSATWVRFLPTTETVSP